MGGSGPRQGTAAGYHVGKIHEGGIGHTQGNVQVPQTHVRVQTKHPFSQPGQRRADPAGQSGLSRSAFSRCDDNDSAHAVPPVVSALLYHILCKDATIFVQEYQFFFEKL